MLCFSGDVGMCLSERRLGNSSGRQRYASPGIIVVMWLLIESSGGYFNGIASALISNRGTVNINKKL